MGTHNQSHNFTEQFEFSGKPKTWSLIAILIGVLAIAFGFLTDHAERTFQASFDLAFLAKRMCVVKLDQSIAFILRISRPLKRQ